MKFLPLLVIAVVLASISAGTINAQKKSKKSHKKTSAKKIEMPKKVEPPENVEVKGDFQTLFEDSQNSLEEPFVYVVRNAQQYAELQQMINNLPSPGQIDFAHQAVVAGFAGTRPTAGYAVNFENRAGGVYLTLATPPPGAISAQVLTSPVKVVVVPVEEEKGLIMTTDKNWQGKMQSFQVQTGNFEYSGGFAPTQQQFAVGGTIKILRAGDYVTAFFGLTANSKLPRQMNDAATGKIAHGEIILPRVDVGNFAENPRPPVKASGQITDKNLSLNFEPLPSNVNDGFSGKGNLTAIRAK